MTGQAGYLRYPHLRGEMLTFTAEDDVWLAPLASDGTVGRAWRVTCERTRVSFPRLSPDGRTVAWTSCVSPAPEVWTAPVEGGEAVRLTWSGSQDTRVLGWVPSGEVLAVSSYHAPFARFTWAYQVPLDGAPGLRLPWGPVDDADIDGEHTLLLTGTAPHPPIAWKRYRGGATGRLWLDGTRLLEGLGGYLASPMLIGCGGALRIAFLSDHEGVGNLYSCLPDGADLRRHTDHAEFYARHAACDGRRVVYQHAGEVWLLDGLDAPAPRRLEVPLGGARLGRRPYQVPASANLGGVVCDATGHASAVLVRGSLYWLTHRDGPARVVADDPGVRVRLPVLLGAERIAWVSDASGQDALVIAEVSGGRSGPGDRAGRHLVEGRIGRVVEIAAAPDGRTVAIAASDGRLLLVDVEGCGVTGLATSAYGPVTGLAFSPDSRWLAWSQAVADRALRRIRLARIDDPGKVHDATCGRFEDAQPCFTDDGGYLVFLSWRGFDPVHDVHTGDMSFPLGCRPYLIPLGEDVLVPFAVPVEGRASDGAAAKAHPVGDGTVRVDPSGLPERLVPFPVIASKYSATTPVRGGVVWLRWPISGALGQTFANPEDMSGQPALEFFDLGRGSISLIAARADGFAVSGDGSMIVVVADGSLRLVDVAAPQLSSPVDLRRITHTVHPVDEWRQAFHEASRIVRDQYWDPDMCGVDWAGLTDQYAPLLERVAGPDDFADVLQELLGELGTSHAYVTPARLSEGPGRPQPPMGLLAMDAHRDGDGRWLVDRVLAGESSDPRARSPLAGRGVRPGDEVMEIAGRPPDPVRGFLPLLGGTGGSTIEIAFRNGSDGGVRRFAVTPLSDERAVRYQDWVTRRRARVRELSAGRCGYLHIPDMGGSGWAQFNRDLRRELNYPAVVVDVRGNAGGSVSQLILDKLSRKVLAWDFTRDRRPARYPRDAPRGPVVAIADEATSSDGDVIVAAFQMLGLGPVVGQRTWGGVVGMTGRHTLVDGTTISVPKNAAWLPDGLGFSVENHGVEPDVAVVGGPLDWAEGRTVQLDAAVRLALELLAEHPPVAAPSGAARPDHRRPPLPPRTR